MASQLTIPVRPTRAAAPMRLPTKGGYTLLPTSLANQGAQLLPTSLANQGARLIDPSVANTLASTQYDQAIADAKAALAQQEQDNAQMLANVGNWYGQVLDSQGRATAQDHALSQAVQGSERDANASILASLGGGANGAAPSVAAAGENNLGTLAALGNIQDQYNADIVPLLKLGQAGASAAQQSANARALVAAMQNVQDLTAQKGAAQAQYGYDIMGQNNQIRDAQANRLLSILGQNNDIRNGRVNSLASIVGANNQAVSAAQGHAIDVRQANTADKQNTIATILGLGVDPATGTLKPSAIQALAKVTGLDPKALTGTDAGTAARIIDSQVSGAVSAANAAEHARHDRVIEAQGQARVKQGQARINQKKTGGGITTSLINAANKTIDAGAAVQPKQHYDNGVPTAVPGTGRAAVSYQDTLKRVIAQGPDTPEWRKKAQALVDARIAPGERGRPWTRDAARTTALQTARLAVQQNRSFDEAREKMLAAGLPKAIVLQALRQAYYQESAFSPIPGSEHYTPAG